MKNNRTISTLPDVGKVPPQAIEAEKSVLGTCLLYIDSIGETGLRPEMFYKDTHQKIFASMLELASKGACDLITVNNDLRNKGLLDSIGGPTALVELTQNVFTDQLLQNHSLLIKQTYLLREYIRMGNLLSSMAYSEDLSDVIEFAESNLFQLSDITQSKEPKHISQAVDQLLAETEKIYNKEKSLVGVPSGYTAIDRITGGWQPGNLIIIAGRPSMGKTALALALASNPARLGYPVCMFSLEMSDSELATRYLSSVSGYSNTEIRNARLDLEKLCRDSDKISRMPVYIDDTPAITLFELRSKIKKMILRHRIRLVIVDYLQLMSATAGSREQEVSIISRGLKAISKELSIPVIALSQLNRSLEDRADKKPRLSDLRESGAIEQDADIVCFIYRPAYYGFKDIDFEGADISSKDLMLLDCAKDRNGALFSVALKHNDSMTIITEQDQ